MDAGRHRQLMVQLCHQPSPLALWEARGRRVTLQCERSTAVEPRAECTPTSTGPPAPHSGLASGDSSHTHLSHRKRAAHTCLLLRCLLTPTPSCTNWLSHHHSRTLVLSQVPHAHACMLTHQPHSPARSHPFSHRPHTLTLSHTPAPHAHTPDTPAPLSCTLTPLLS